MQLSARRPAPALLDLGIAITRLVRTHAARTRPAGLTLVELRALGAVDADPDLLLKDLALVMGLTPATTSRLAARLVRHGLVERRADPSDARAARVRLSRRGAAALGRALRTLEAVIDARLTGLDAADRRAIVRIAERVLPALAPDRRTS
ncbi:MAG TPA: MarR family transcriptional regulator [Vicinamibacterales bacterium]|jgi:DNA-binding MarR family transcriptional regulator|nr:MarR family transcriptional regulator [Vicinamibacterales bacterium]